MVNLLISWVLNNKVLVSGWEHRGLNGIGVLFLDVRGSVLAGFNKVNLRFFDSKVWGSWRLRL